MLTALNAPTPGGLTWIQINKLIRGLVGKGCVPGMGLVELSPALENSRTTHIHAGRLLCNLIGATVRGAYYDQDRPMPAGR